MSNRSYMQEKYFVKLHEFGAFQFPVGMSNRYYSCFLAYRILKILYPFNSPWECRIGITMMDKNKKLTYARTFNSPWECRIGITMERIPKSPLAVLFAFQFPVGMSNRYYSTHITNDKN